MEPDAKNPWTPLMWASYQGKAEEVAKSLSEGADVAWTSPVDASQPLYWAARQGHAAAAELLLNAGASMAAATVQGWTPLMAACYNGHLDVVRLLLSRGCDVEGRDGEGRTALYFAVRYKRPTVEKTLLQHGADSRSVIGSLASSYRSQLGFGASCHGRARTGGRRPAVLNNVSPSCLKVLEEEEQTYCMWRARRLFDDGQITLQSEDCNYAAQGGNANDGTERISFRPAAQTSRGGAARRKRKGTEAMADGEPLVLRVCRYVMKDLTWDLFVELMEYFK